ncbi:MAG TPA: glycosyltransferase family 4 protein [Thermoanaerobaculia bacterium]|nr:glycosyltransferase family 4 protein [Thermoanaerobaculia bacterium]
MQRAAAVKLLHVVSFDRWTGAAAPAFSEVEALRAAGVDAHYAFVPGSTLQGKLGSLPFTHGVVERDSTPWGIRRSARRLRELIEDQGFQLVHAHLTHDHWLARLAARPLPGVRLLRTFHSRRTLRRDPVTRWLLAGTDGVCVSNFEFTNAPTLRGRLVAFTPPPVDETQFRPGTGLRDHYGIGPEVPLLGFIGKVDEGRGFEDAIRVHAILRAAVPGNRLLIIGRGPLRPSLEALSRELGVAESVIWAGYHEGESLAAHFRTPDLLLFTARGSDEGHRAVLEAMGCGTPVAAYPIEGIPPLLGRLAATMVSGQSTPESLSGVAASFFRARAITSRDAVEAAASFRYGPAAERLHSFYREVAGRSKSLG